MKRTSLVDKKSRKITPSPAANKRGNRSPLRHKRDEDTPKYFQALSENSLAGEYVIQNGRLIYANPAMSRIFGYSQAELIGQDALNLVHADDRPAAHKELNIPAKGKTQPLHFECRGVHKDGHAIHIEMRVGTSITLDGRPAMLGTVLEVTKHKKGEELLRKLSRAVEQSPATVVITNALGNIEFVNPKFTRLTGYTRDEVLGQNPRILKSNLTPAKVYDELWKTILSGRNWHGEFINRKKNGELYWESASISPIKNSAGIITNFLAVKEDISERKKAEDALRKAEEESRKLFAEAVEGIVRVSTEGRFLLANPAVAKILGYNSAEEFMTLITDSGRQVWESPEDRLLMHRLIEEQGAVRGHECRFRRKDGTLIWVSINARKTAGPDGQTEYYQGSFEDITERRKARQALEEANQKLAMSMEVLKGRSEEIATLSEFGRLLQSCLSREEAYQIIKAYCHKLFPSFSGGVYLTAASRNLVQVVTAWGQPDVSEPNFAPDECWALRGGRMHCVAEPNAPAQCGHMPHNPGLSYLCLPLMAQGEAMGILHIECAADFAGMSPEDLEEFKRSRQELAGAVAEHVALALANLQLRETLRSQSIRDPLTGLYNRRYMEESLEREILRASRSNSPIGILILDVDHFKDYNDTFGHEAGDVVLREVGSLLQKQVREEDIACRFGGEEFVLILPGTPLEVARERAEHLRESVRQLTVGFRGQTLAAITVSLGLAIYPEHGSSAESILESADQALYMAKQSGRNRTVFAAPVAQHG